MYVHIYLLCFRYKAKEFRESMLLRKYNKGVSLFKSIFICITNIFDQAVQLGGCWFSIFLPIDSRIMF